MSATEAAALSKSARKRANKKAREAEEAVAEEPVPVAPAPAPKATPKATPKAEPKAKAKAEPKAEPKAKAKAEPKAEPKAKAKAEPKAKSQPQSEPAAAPKADAKAKAKSKAAPAAESKTKPEAGDKADVAPKAKAKAASAKPTAKAGAKAQTKKPEPEPEIEKSEPTMFIEYDDGKGGDWEVSTGISKKMQKRKDRLEEEKKELAALKAAGHGKLSNQHIPGMAPPEVVLAQQRAEAQSLAQKAIADARAAGKAAKNAGDAALQEAEKKEKDSTTATIKVPQEKIGRVIGPKGANITLIKEKTGVERIETEGDMCVVTGPEKAVTLAEHAIRQLIDKGYMSLAFDNFEETSVQVHPSVFPNLIGEKGVVIQKIKSEAKVEIDIPQGIPKDAIEKPKKYKVSIAGSKAGVEKAKEIINAIAMYSCHEVTHPGLTHQEVEIEEWRHRFLIGTKGSTMRHIQNNYKVKVNIPREFSANDKVVIVGEARDIERATKYIEKIMWEADQPKGRGAADKADDGWGEEEDVEDWMAPYMYKRK